MSIRQILLAAALGLACAQGAAAAESADALAEQAQAAYNSHDYARSADLFEEAVAAGGSGGVLRYNAACANALAGRADRAFEQLRQAVAAGYGEPGQFEADTDLASLHADARWAPLLAQAAQASARRNRMWNSPALATPYRETLDEDERVAGLSKLWSEAKFNFANFDLVPDLDWDASYLEFLPRVRQAGSTVAYYLELQAFIARLHDGHSNVWLASEANDLAYAKPGLATRLVEGKVLVKEVFDPALAGAGIARGWEVASIDGEPVVAYAERTLLPVISASTAQDRASRSYERFLLRGPVSRAVRVGFVDAAGGRHEFELPRMPGKAYQAALPAQKSFDWQLLPGDIAWVQLRSFDDDSAAVAFEAAFAEIAKARALILDVRENGGGNGSVGQRILATIAEKPFPTSKWRTREYRPAFRAWGEAEGSHVGPPTSIAPNAKLHFAGPVLVLTSPRTYSAAEDFALSFDLMQRGRIVGQPSGGSTGQPLLLKLPGGGGARICTKRDSYPDGREFVGVGIQPQVVVEPRVDDFRAGRDTVLDAALKLLGETAR
jgi:C-terminal processing protease CtpA/Prc